MDTPKKQRVSQNDTNVHTAFENGVFCPNCTFIIGQISDKVTAPLFIDMMPHRHFSCGVFQTSALGSVIPLEQCIFCINNNNQF